MKNVLIIIFLVFNTIATATDYYMSSSGYDTNNGLSSSTPWKTITKLNTAFPTMKPGDRILFKRGDVFTGQINLTRSGSSAANIIFDAFGVGNTPVIQGNIDLVSWTRYNGDIWVADCQQLGSAVTNFLINGKSQQIGRYPNADATNKGYLTISSHVGNTQLTCASLASSTNWTGSEAVVRCNRWVLDRIPIQSHQGNVFIFSKPTSYEIKDNFGFFIQNNLNTLDQAGEWFFDSANNKMYLFWSTDPNSLNTQASVYASTFIANNQNYFTVGSLEFRGSLNATISIKNSQNIEMKNITVSESGTNGVYLGGCKNINFINNKIINTNNNGLIFDLCENVVARNNEIRHTAIRSGMGVGSDGQYTGLYVSGTNNYLESNIVDSVGYVGIHFRGNLVTIKNNFISNFCMTKDDAGGLYTWSDGKSVYSDRRLESNIILNGIGAGEGTDNPSYVPANGIYMDDRSDHISVINNTIANCNNGILIRNANHISLIGNTIYNNNMQVFFVHDQVAQTFPIANCIVNNNIFFAKTSVQMTLSFLTISDDIGSLGTSDYNFFARPLKDSLTFKTWSDGWDGVSITRTLAGWQSLTSQDANSVKSPISLTDINKIRFEYNATNSNKVVSLNGSYIDVNGTKFSGSITLLPYSSAILMIDPKPSVPSINPVYVSSSIENATPTILELNYNLSLANSVPSVSAFSVKVNSVTRK